MRVLSPVKSPRGFWIIPVHYSHDPEKDESWRRSERAKYTDEASWAREQELDFGSVSGILAYPNFRRSLHLRNDITVSQDLPLCLAVDFNVEPMVWEVAQIKGEILYSVDEIYLQQGSTQEAIDEFRRRYPSHGAGVRIYGDATGAARSTQTASSDYDLIRLGMRSYPSEVRFLIPRHNPVVKDRLNAVNARLLTQRGEPGWFINPASCQELVKDLQEVVLDPGRQGSILKSRRRDEPYFYRTHASDAIGYLIFFEWPVMSALARRNEKLPQRRWPSFVLGGMR